MQFGKTELKLAKTVKKGDKESLLTLFDAENRFKPILVLTNAEVGTPVKVTLGGLGEAELLLGADMERGRKKTIMTLFWFAERSKLMEMKKDAKEGRIVPVTIITVNKIDSILLPSRFALIINPQKLFVKDQL